jgi:hypothetical protein
MAKFLVAVICILLLIIVYPRKPDFRGFWRTRSDFNHESELSEFCLYIGDNGDGFLLMVDYNGNQILNQRTKVNISKLLSGYKIQFSDLPQDPTKGSDGEIFPSKLKLEYYPQIQKMILYNESGETNSISAILYKDLNLTELSTTNLVKSESL